MQREGNYYPYGAEAPEEGQEGEDVEDREDAHKGLGKGGPEEIPSDKGEGDGQDTEDTRPQGETVETEPLLLTLLTLLTLLLLTLLTLLRVQRQEGGPGRVHSLFGDGEMGRMASFPLERGGLHMCSTF